MSTIHLTHPLHGSKSTSMEAEAVNDEANGWVRVVPEVPKAVVSEAKEIVVPEAPKAAPVNLLPKKAK